MAAAARERVEHLWRAAHVTCAQQPGMLHAVPLLVRVMAAD